MTDKRMQLFLLAKELGVTVVSEPAAGIVDGQIDIWPNSSAYGYTSTRDNAEELMRQLDLALFPWGEPGVVPTEPGDYSVTVDGCTPMPVVLGPDGWHYGDYEKWIPWDGTAMYCQRWTREAPTP